MEDLQSYQGSLFKVHFLLLSVTDIKVVISCWYYLGTEVERVTVFKLLGVHISDNLKWAQHVDALASKVGLRLKQLKRSGASTEHLVCFHASVVRPVLEYACPVWHSGLTTGQSDMLESLQKRALKIIFCDIDYHMSLILAGLDTLQS